MKVIILAAGQGTRLRPLTDNMPKCMVKINDKSIIERTIDIIADCGIHEKDIYIVTGYRSDVLEKFLHDRKVNFIHNGAFETTNMVCSLMCAAEVMQGEEDIIVSYGDIAYEENVLRKTIDSGHDISVVVDDGWFNYWQKRCENPLDDAETLIIDAEDCLKEIGQKTKNLSDIQSQYIGLIHFHKNGITKTMELCREAKKRSDSGKKLWRTDRNYSKMYMTDLLQGLIDEGNQIKAIHIKRGWYEVDCQEDLLIAEQELGK